MTEDPELIDVRLNEWKEVPFSLSDKEMAEVADTRVLPQVMLRAIIKLADTVNTDELLQLEHEQLLTRLFHEDPLTLFPSQKPAFACSCSRQRCQTALGAISPDELMEIFEEQDEISMDCEFCNQQYMFTAADLSAELERVIPPPVH